MGVIFDTRSGNQKRLRDGEQERTRRTLLCRDVLHWCSLVFENKYSPPPCTSGLENGLYYRRPLLTSRPSLLGACRGYSGFIVFVKCFKTVWIMQIRTFGDVQPRSGEVVVLPSAAGQLFQNYSKPQQVASCYAILQIQVLPTILGQIVNYCRCLNKFRKECVLVRTQPCCLPVQHRTFQNRAEI